MTRGLLKAVARGLISVLLFAQFAIASYACPGLVSPSTAGMKMEAASAAVPEQGSGVAGPVAAAPTMNCDEMAGVMDPSMPNLCAEHCRYGQQSDHAATITVPTLLLIALYSTPQAPEKVVPPYSVAATMSALVAASPPHAVLHCVYRI